MASTPILYERGRDRLDSDNAERCRHGGGIFDRGYRAGLAGSANDQREFVPLKCQRPRTTGGMRVHPAQPVITCRPEDGVVKLESLWLNITVAGNIVRRKRFTRAYHGQESRPEKSGSDRKIKP